MADVIGKSIPRLDGFDKVTGRTQYIDDMDIEGALIADIIRSPIPNGKIRHIKFNPKFDWSRITICNYKDIPGKNATIFLMEDQPILAEKHVRHIGEAVLLIAAEDLQIIENAKANINIDYEELTPVLSIKDSETKKNIIWGKDNIQSHYHIIKGNIKKGFEEADHIIEGTYKTGFHEHIYIEPQGCAAIPRKDGGIRILSSCQCPFYILKTLKAVLDCDESKVNVVQTTMGGAFGGKEDYPSLMCSYVAILAKKSGKPVKLIYKRDEDIEFTTKRHPSIIKHKTGVKKDGTITAMEIDVKMDGGAYSTLSPVVLSRGVIHAAGVYKCENTESKAKCFATNVVPTGAFRGFGAPQVFFALETHMDKVAEKIGMNPYEFRLQNCVEMGDTLSTTQLLRESVAAKKCLRKVETATNFEKKWKKYNILRTTHNEQRTAKKGIGISVYMHGGAFTGSGEAIMKTEAALKLEKNGKVKILTGITDMGQGSFTVIPQITADALGVSIDDIRCVTPDTAVVPDSGPTVASRCTMIIGSVMEDCAKEFKEKIISFAAEHHNLKKEGLSLKNGFIYNKNKKIAEFKETGNLYLRKKGELKVIKRYKLPSYIKWDAAKHLGDAYPAYSWAADIAEVTVDTETFEVSVDKITVAVDTGKTINPLALEGQMEGGSLQGLGWGLLEHVSYDNGKILNNRLQSYIIPTILDTPKWKIITIEDPFSSGPHGAKGIGELPHNGPAPAIANAIYNAIGVRVDSLPITPEKLFKLSGGKIG